MISLIQESYASLWKKKRESISSRSCPPITEEAAKNGSAAECICSLKMSEPHTRPELGLDVAGHDLQDSPCFRKTQKQLYLEPTQFWPPCCVMFTFLNPAITAGHGPSYLQDSTPFVQLILALTWHRLEREQGTAGSGSLLPACFFISMHIPTWSRNTSLIWWDCHMKWSRRVQNGTGSKHKIRNQHL